MYGQLTCTSCDNVYSYSSRYTAVHYHWTKNDISYNSAFQNMTFPGISYTFLVEDRATFHANERNVQKILPYPADFLQCIIIVYRGHMHKLHVQLPQLQICFSYQLFFLNIYMLQPIVVRLLLTYTIIMIISVVCIRRVCHETHSRPIRRGCMCTPLQTEVIVCNISTQQVPSYAIVISFLQ